MDRQTEPGKQQRHNRIQKWLPLMALALMLSPLTTWAGTLGDLTYTSDGSTITITSCSRSATNISIPDMIEGLPVTTIDSYTFYSRTNLVSITIPDNVTSIGDYAFTSCTSLTNVFLNEGITNIGFKAFLKCASLPEISVDPKNDFYTSHDGVLFNKELTMLLQCPAGKAGSYEIPGSVTNITDEAFKTTSLTNVFIPASVTSIGEWVFEWSTDIAALNVDETNPVFSSLDGVLFNKDQTTIIQYPGGKTNSSYTIPDGIDNIGGGAFSFSYNLSEAVIPNTVTNIGPGAFRDCLGFNSIIIPDGVVSLEWMSFFHCTNLTTITIPNTVTHIGDDAHPGAFERCASLTHITIPDSVTSIGGWAFSDCSSLTEVVMGKGVTNIGSNIFQGCSSLSRAVIKSPSVEQELFAYVYSLTDVVFENSVTNIGNSAFKYCTALTNIVIGANITSIDHHAFYNCSNLNQVYFIGDAPTVDSSTFWQSYNTTIYYLPGTSGWGTTFGERPTVLWNPTLRETGVLTNGFSFNITGTDDIPIAIEACTNLADGIWIPLQTGTLSGGSLDFTDPDWTNYPARVYRIVAP